MVFVFPFSILLIWLRSTIVVLHFFVQISVTDPVVVDDARQEFKVITARRPHQWDGSPTFEYEVNGQRRKIENVYSVRTRERQVHIDGKPHFVTVIVTSENLEYAKAPVDASAQ